MPTENELKLVMSEPLLSRLRRHPLLKSLKQGPGSRKHLVSVYYDTAEHTLFKRNLALRVRNDGGRRVQTLKAQAAGLAGLASRGEWEREIAGPHPELGPVSDATVSKVLADIRARRGALKPVFATDVTRTAWNLRLPDGSEVALAFDVGEVKTGRKRVPICEAELELRSGKPESLFDLAAKLHDDIPFQLENRSKSSRGYAMLAGAEPESVKAQPLALKRRMTVEAVFKAIARNCLGHLEANEACATLGEDAEGVHQMRVALRRLRSAFAIFREALPVEPANEISAELAWFTGELAAARDWDVFIAETLAPLAERLHAEPGVAALIEAAAAARGRGYDAARLAMTAPRYTELKLQLGVWLAAPAWAAIAPEEQARLLAEPIHDFADRVLQRRYRRLRKIGNGHRELSLDELHRLRIRAKKVRYAAEFFRRFYPRRRVKDFIAATTALQDMLGGVNDVSVARVLLNEIKGEIADGALRERAEALALGWLAARERERIGRFTERWDRFTDCPVFWRQPSEAAEVNSGS